MEGGLHLSTDPHSIFTISSKRLYDKCPLAWYFRHRLDLDHAKRSDALQQGIDFHEGAEEAYLGEEPTSVLGLGYAEWVEDLEEFRAESVESPFLVPMPVLYSYAHREPPKFLPGNLYFGGVVDLVGRHLDKGTLHIMDHKRVQRFYPYPYLYATEQLGMYQVAMTLAGKQVDGVSISRVKVKDDIQVPHMENYINRYLRLKQGFELSKGNMQVALSNIRKYTDTHKHIHKHSNTNTNAIALQSLGQRAVRVRLREPRSRSHSLLKSVSMYSPEGYRVLSIQRNKGTLLHIERQFYTLSPEELRNIVRDFLMYVEEVNTPGKKFRRAPGIYPCPFEDLCRATRLVESDLTLVGLDSWGLVKRPPNQEVLDALEKGR